MRKSLINTQPCTHEYHEPDELSVGALAALPGDDVPLLGGTDDDLGVGDLFLGQLMVPRQLVHPDTVRLQPLLINTDIDIRY